MPNSNQANNKLGIAFIDKNSSFRDEVEASIAIKYAETYNAEIYHYAPLLLTIYNNHLLMSTIGICFANEGSLFLERYLNAPIEHMLSNNFKLQITRDQIIELGNYVAFTPFSGIYAMIATASWIEVLELKLDYAMFTATEALAALFKKIKFPICYLSDASPDCLQFSERMQWGSYYDSNPSIYSINIHEAISYFKKNFANEWAEFYHLVNTSLDFSRVEFEQCAAG